MTGPLSGLRVVEFSAIGPVPFCGMLLADMGAHLLRLDRQSDPGLGIGKDQRFDVLGRGKRSVAVDLKRPQHVALAGALHAMGRPQDPPPPPLAIVGDFAGGAAGLGHDANRDSRIQE